MTIMKSEPLSEALNFPKKGEMLRGVKVLDAKSKFRSPIFEYQITFPKGTKSKDIPAMLKQFFNTQIVDADKNYMVTHHDYRVKPFEGNVCVVGSMQLIEMIRTNPSVKLQEFDKHYSKMEMTNPETFFRKFKCASFNSPQFRAQLFSYVSYMGENYGYSIDGCIYHRRASLIMPKIKITKAIPQAKMMYHTHPSKDEPSLSSADDYLLYFDLSHKPRNIRHFYTVMKDRMDYFQITPKKDSKEDYVKLSEDKIIDEINAKLDELEEMWAEKIPKDTGHANDMKFCENITRDLVKWINKKYKNYFKVKYTCYHRVRKNPETLAADDLHLGDEFIAKALNDIKTGEYSWPTFKSSAMPHEKYAYWHQMYYDHHVRDSFMTLGVNMQPGDTRRMDYYLQSKAPESEANYSDLLNILNISHDIAASDSKVTDGGKVNSRVAEIAEYLELPTNVIDDLKLLEEIIYTMDVFSEEAKTLAGDYYGVILLSNYSINAISIMNQVHSGKLDLTIAKQDVYHNLKMRTQEALASFFVQKNRRDGIRINPAITIAKLELVTQFPREAFDYFDIVEDALAEFSKSRLDPTKSFYVKNTGMMYLSVPTSKGNISMNLSYRTGKAQIFATKVDDPMEAAIEAVNKVGMALYRNGAQGINPNEFSINIATPLMNPQPKVIIISGPSGAGKSTTIRNLLRRLPNAKTAPSYTTRQSRKSDKPGEKVFLSKEKFVKKLESGDMIAARLQKNGHYYGRLRSDFNHSGYVIVDVNLSGLRDIKREFPKALTAYLEPVEDPKFIERRLLMRGDMSPQEARKRSSIIPSHIASSKKINFDLRIKTRQGYFNEASDKIFETLPRSNPDHTKQDKLPKELTEGADVSDLSAEDWFTKEGKKKLAEKRKAKAKKEAEEDEEQNEKFKQQKLFEEARAQGIEDATEIVEEEIEDNPRIPKKYEGQDPSEHSDLYTDEDPKGTIQGLGFKDKATAERSVNIIKRSGKTHAHKIQAAMAMEQRARFHPNATPGIKAAQKVYDNFSEEMKKKTKRNPSTEPLLDSYLGIENENEDDEDLDWQLKSCCEQIRNELISIFPDQFDLYDSMSCAELREYCEFAIESNLSLEGEDGELVTIYRELLESWDECDYQIVANIDARVTSLEDEYGNWVEENPKKTPEGRKIPKRYLKGLNKEEMAIAAKEIDKGYKYDISDPKAYEYWKSDIKATARGYKTVPSKYKKKFIQMYGPLPEKGKFLDKMAKATKIKKSILQKVYDKGLAAWRGGHRPGVQQHQWAAGRVYSFVTLGNTVKKGNKKMPDYKLAVEAGLVLQNPSNQEVIKAGYLQGVNDVIEVVEDETEDPDNPDLVVYGDIYNFKDATIGPKSRVFADNLKSDRGSNIQNNPSRSKPTLEQFRKWVELVNMKNKELKAFLDSDWFKESGLTPAQAKAQGIKSGQDSFRSIIRMRKKLGLTGPKDYIKEGPQITKKYYEMAVDKWSGPDNKVSALDDRTDWGWMMRQIRFNSRASAFPYNKAAEGRKGPLVKKQKTQNQPSRKLLSLWVWGHDPWRWARKHGVESMPKCPKVPWVGMTEKRKYGSIPVIMSPKTKKNPGHCPIEVEARRAASDPSFKHHEWYIEHHLDYVMAIAKAIVNSDEPEDQQLIHDMVWMHDYPKMMGDKENFELVRNLVSKYRSERYTDRLMNQLRWMEEIKSPDWSKGTTTIAAVMSTADALAHYYGPFFQIYHDENPDKPIEALKRENAEKLEKDKRKLRAGPMKDGLDSVKLQYKGRKVRVVGNEHIADLVARKNPSSADFFPGDANVAHPSLISQTIPITSLQGDWRHGKFSEEDPFEEYFEE